MPRNRVFISYSRDDLRHLEEFQEILSPFLGALPEIWSDRKIAPGEAWKQQILSALQATKVAVMLVTPSFLASDFIKGVEFPAILRAQEKQGLIIFWIPVSSCGYKHTALKEFQAAWEPARPLDLMTRPKRRKALVEIAEKLMNAAGEIEQTDVPRRPRVVVLHRAGTQPDESILGILERDLPQEGYEFFSVRESTPGVLNQLDSHLTRADSVIPLISALSDSSELLALQVEMARERSEKQSGRPQIIPIFIQYDHPPGGVGQTCRPFRCVIWSGNEHNAALVKRLLTVMNGGEDPLSENAKRGSEASGDRGSGQEIPGTLSGIHVVSGGGAVAPGDPRYIARGTDHELARALSSGVSIVRVQGARQMGKTSLVLRGLRLAREIGARTASVDFQSFNRSQFNSYDSFYKSLAETLLEELGLDASSVAGLWTSAGPNANLERIMQSHVLPCINGRLVWAMDEVERLFQFDLSDDFFGLIRSWHNRRASAKAVIWHRLTIVISHATESHLLAPGLIRNPNASPFNPDFSR